MNKKTIVFDLDDTLVHEYDYLQSAFREIALTLDPGNETLCSDMLKWYQNKENVFARLIEAHPTVELDLLKKIYRNHTPDWEHFKENRELLLSLKANGNFLGLISDGYAITQRNKLKALQIEDVFDLVIISEEFGSEKPHENNFKAFHTFNTDSYVYIADNVSKDFITPNALGWETICLLDQGYNIHGQDFNKEYLYLPKHKINALSELNLLLNQASI